MSPPFHPPHLSPSAVRRIATAGTITGRLLVAFLFFALGMMLAVIGVELIRSDAGAFATWRTAAGCLVVLIGGAAFESYGSIVLRSLRP